MQKSKRTNKQKIYKQTQAEGRNKSPAETSRKAEERKSETDKQRNGKTQKTKARTSRK